MLPGLGPGSQANWGIMNFMQQVNPFDPDSYPAHKTVSEMLAASYEDMAAAMRKASEGYSCRIHQLDQTVTFILDNQEEVHLRVRKIETLFQDSQVKELNVLCRTDFENVLILAKKLNMRISAFSTYFTVHLTAEKDFMHTWNDAIMAMDHPAKFFETLDEIKRPIFLNLNHYVISRISD